MIPVDIKRYRLRNCLHCLDMAARGLRSSIYRSQFTIPVDCLLNKSICQFYSFLKIEYSPIIDTTCPTIIFHKRKQYYKILINIVFFSIFLSIQIIIESKKKKIRNNLITVLNNLLIKETKVHFPPVKFFKEDVQEGAFRKYK